MKTLNTLFLCTGNSCRSIMAEALLSHYGAGKFRAFSAGSFPTGEVNPLSLATIRRHGISDKGYHSKSWNEFKNQQIDILITVCDNAADEICPIFHGSPVKAHWGVPDPAHFQGTTAEIEAEFERVFIMLERRVKAMVALSAENLGKDELQHKMNEIGGNS